MRFLLILAALVALPVLTLLQRQYFVENLQDPLRARVIAALDDPEFAGVEKKNITMDHLDVSLNGWVADPEVRRHATERVARVRGVRCRDDDNHLQVPARVTLELKGDKAGLSGWLHDSIILRDVVQWLQQYRPGLEVETSGIRISQYVSRVESPLAKEGGSLSPVLSEAATIIRIPASLRILKAGDTIYASGALPGAELRDAVLQAVLGSRAETTIDSRQLKAGPYVKPARFTDAKDLPAFLQSFFNSPAPELFETDGDKVRVTGHATPDLDHEWRKLLTTLVEDDALKAKWRIFPSPYHFPGYRPQSGLAAEELENLRCALQGAVIYFDSGNLSLGPQEMLTVIAAAQAIQAAGPNARIIVGAFPDAVDDAKLNEAAARKRIESVITALVDKGVQKQQLETVIFEVMPPPDGANLSRSIEMLVK
ncbi:MAG: hypothetical protein WCN98_03910 [Verrucomicrobiaceae bacterium]